jgi:hypothetical protein
VIVITEEEKENFSNTPDWTTKSLNVEKRENTNWMEKGLNVKVIEDFQKDKNEE